MGKRDLFRRARPPLIVLGLALLALVAFQSSALVAPKPERVAATQPTVVVPGDASEPSAWAVQQRLRAAQEVAKELAARAVREQQRVASRPDLAAFRGLGAWVDLYDLALDPAASVRVMRAHGVRTLYLQTGRYNTEGSIAYEDVIGRWLVEAHRAGLKVVGWYLPGYGRYLKLDVERTVAIAKFAYAGHRFDALGIDIEWRREVPNALRWSRHVASHAKVVRARLGAGYPIAAIPPPPLQMAVSPGYWRGFPWREIAQHSDVIMPMAYWSTRSGCPRIRVYCAYDYTVENIREVRRLTGDRKIPIHIVGGIGDEITGTDVSLFVRAAHNAGAIGASLYDFATTSDRFWRPLRRLSAL